MRRPALWLTLLLLSASSAAAQEGPADALAASPGGQSESQAVFSQDGRELPLDLKRAIGLALETNEDVMLSRIDFERSAAELTGAHGIFEPLLTVESNYRDATTPQPNVFNPVNPVVDETEFNIDFSLGGLLPTGTSYALAVANRRTTSTSGFVTLSPQYAATTSAQLTQPLLKGFGLGVNLGGVRIAHTQKSIAVQEFERAVSTVILETIEAYWELAFAIDNLKNQQESLQVARDLVRIAENRVRVKLDAPVALTQAREGAARREENVLIAENQLGVAEDNLKRLIGLTRNNIQLNARIRLVEPSADERAALLSADEAIKLARLRRPEYEAARLTFENLDTASRMARNASLPELDLTLEAGLVGVGGDVAPVSGAATSIPLNRRFGGEFGTAYDQIFGADTPYWKVGAVFRIPLGGRQSKAELRIALLDEQVALEQFKILDKTILLEVRSAIRSVLTDLKRIRTTELSVKLAEENLDAERRRYQVGLSTSFDVLEQEEKLNLARTGHRRAVADYNISLARYQKAVATLLDTYGIVLAEEPEPVPPPVWTEGP